MLWKHQALRNPSFTSESKSPDIEAIHKNFRDISNNLNTGALAHQCEQLLAKLNAYDSPWKQWTNDSSHLNENSQKLELRVFIPIQHISHRDFLPHFPAVWVAGFGSNFAN